MSTHKEVPLRVDFAGGWFDVPHLADPEAFIVNCAITPLVSKDNWPYHRSAGLGGSAAAAILAGRDGVDAELELGVGWQDPAVILETGFCAWHSGPEPKLYARGDSSLLQHRMALRWTGQAHYTPGLVNRRRDYEVIKIAGQRAREALVWSRFARLAYAVRLSYAAQLDEGMAPLQTLPGVLAMKYCGGGHGGYALYLFHCSSCRDLAVTEDSAVMAIEPYLR